VPGEVARRAAGRHAAALPAGAPLKLPLDVDAYMAGQRSAALLVVHDGKLRLERYGLGLRRPARWTSFSVAKSMTSTLVGAALRDGHIRSMDDKVSDYIPQMKGSAYDDVSIRQLLTMTSGVRWNEDYADPNSDVARFNNHKPEAGRRCARELPAPAAARSAAGHALELQHRRNQPRGHPRQPGHEEALAPTCRERSGCRPAWNSRPPGSSADGQEISGCCLQAASRDFARFGLFILGGARVDGQPIVPDGWLAKPRPAAPASASRAAATATSGGPMPTAASPPRHLRPGHLHRPQAQDRDRFQRQLGRRRTGPRGQRAREAFYRRLQKAVDDEGRGAPSERRGALKPARAPGCALQYAIGVRYSGSWCHAQ
jgi:CubicO group peptidase (beta-lactamase class C family)